MLELIDKLQPILEVVAQALMGLIVLATALSRVVGNGKYKEDVDKASSKVVKLIAWLPTLGINPHTKALEKAYEEMKERNKQLVSKG